jgi:arylsulfatase A-like enzyme
VQTIDLAPTLLGFFGVGVPASMEGSSLEPVIADDTRVREAGLFGRHGGHMNVTDGRYVYMRAPATKANGPLYEYTLMPTHMERMFAVSELQDIRLAEPFDFTKGCRTMKIATKEWWEQQPFETLLFDLAEDPGQEHPIKDAAVEKRMIELMVALMRKNDAPPEQFERLGLEV